MTGEALRCEGSSQDVFVVGAEFFSLAGRAVGAAPDGVELFHDLADDSRIIGDDA